MNSWRLIIEGKKSASYNMAADDYLLELAEKRESPPIIRLYGWDVPSITIGYHQKLKRAVDITKLDDTPVVQRITGGRALYHDDAELTYAVSGNFIAYPQLGEDLNRSYRLISEAVVLFYGNLLGWQAEIARRDDPIGLGGKAEKQKGCFSALSRHEIIVNGQKTAAGSQRRTKQALMQHGAIKLGPPVRHPAIVEMPQTDALEKLAVDLPPQKELVAGLVEALEKTYSAVFVVELFTPGEEAEIASRMARFKNINSD
ncbi:MAG: hypothetical protein GY841_19775 [FCB group bacterium]|nr:hypothetical protein [FCB group bacterium]